MLDTYRIYLDLEYLYPRMTKERGRPTEKEKRQIVQIGAILFDAEKNKELASFNILTQPTFDKMLPNFFVELTHITQQMVDQGAVPLIQGLEKFVEFSDNYPIWTFFGDQSVLEQNCSYLGIEPLFQQKFIKVKNLLPTWGIDPNAYSSGTLFKAAGLSLKGHVHNALHDVRSMAHAVWVFEHKSCDD